MTTLYRSLARLLLPPSFFREYGTEMARSVENLLGRADNSTGRALVLLEELADLLRTAFREWWSLMKLWNGPGSRGPHDVGRGRSGGTRDVMGTWMKDVQYAARTLLRRPGFTSVAVLTLALGIGGTAAIFTVVDHVLIRALPYEDAHRLAFVWSTDAEAPGSSRGWTSYPDYQELRAQQTSFETMTAYRTSQATLTGAGTEPTSVASVSVDAHLPRVFRLSPVLGRWFTPGEDRVGGPALVVLGHAFWRQRFGGDPSIVGGTLTVDGIQHEIIGVMPAGFTFPDNAEIYRPLARDAGQDSRGMHRLIVSARLAEGSSLDRANEDVLTISRRLEEAYPGTNRGEAAFAEPFREAYVSNARPPLLILMGAVGLLLLIVCSNVANLLLARAADRSGEMALRSALGAARGRLVRQLLTEAVLLAGAGGVLGLGLAHFALEGLLAIAPATLPLADRIVLDGRVISYMLVVSLGATVLFGLTPALRASRMDVREAMAQAGPSVAWGASRLRGALVVSEVALAMMLAVGAGLLIRSFSRVQALDPGFRAEDLYAVPLSLPLVRYPLEDWQRTTDLFRRVQDAVEGIPDVRSASLAYAHPVQGGWTTSFWLVDDGPQPPPAERPEARYRPVGSGYFRTVGIPIVRGRAITDQDDASAPPVVVVNEAFLHTYLRDREPLGARVLKETWWEGTPAGEWEIVGVAADVRFMGVEQGSQPAIYYPFAQRPMSEMVVMIRSETPLGTLAPRIKEAIWTVDSRLPVEGFESMEEALRGSTAARTFNTLLLGLFAAIALVLAAVGIYGVVAYTVTRRTHEMGIRMSLGADRGRVQTMVLKRGFLLALGGVVIGWIGAMVLTRVLSSLLFGISATDPPTYGAVGVVLLLSAGLATWLPARRATRVDPVAALRAE